MFLQKLSKLICGLCTVSLVCVLFVYKVSSFCLTYFHLKQTHSHLRVLPFLKSTLLLEAHSLSFWLKFSASLNAKHQPGNLQCAAPKIKFHINTVPLAIAGVSEEYILYVMAQLAKIIKCSFLLVI